MSRHPTRPAIRYNTSPTNTRIRGELSPDYQRDFQVVFTPQGDITPLLVNYTAMDKAIVRSDYSPEDTGFGRWILGRVQRVEGGTMLLAIRRWSPHGPPVRLQRPTSTTKHGWRVLLQEPSRPGALMHAERSCGRLCVTPCFDTPGHVLTACACVFDYLNSLLSSLSVCPNTVTTT